MRTIIIQSPWNATAVERETPRPKKGETLLKMIYGGICGSGLAFYREISAYVSYPRTIGHEFAAEVVEIGGSVYGIKPGMIVTGNPYFNHGTRYSYRRGMVNYCVRDETMGVQREGVFSDYLTMPVGCLCDDQGIDPKELVLIEPFCISCHGVSRVSVKPGDKMLVFGVDAIGILAGMAIKSFETRAYITDIAREKVETMIRDLHLDGGFVNESRERLDAFVQEITGGDGSDVTVEAVGAPSTFLGCVQTATNRGRAVVIGAARRSTDFNFLELQRRELEVYGSRAATAAGLAAVMKLVRDGSVNLKKLVSRTYPTGSATEVSRGLDQNHGEIIKVEFGL